MLMAMIRWLGRRRGNRGPGDQLPLGTTEAGARLQLVDLRTAIDRLLDATEARFGAQLHFVEDFYWNVPLTQAIDINHAPRPDLGSVTDDAESVRTFAAEAASDHVTI